MVHCEMGRGGMAAPPQHTLEFRGFDETRQWAADRRPLRHSRMRSLDPSDGQALPAFGAARVDDRPAAARFHADEKPMGAGAANFGCLVGTFHDDFRGPCRLVDGPGAWPKPALPGSGAGRATGDYSKKHRRRQPTPLQGTM